MYKKITEKRKKELNMFYVKNFLKVNLKEFKKALFLKNEVECLRLNKDIKNMIEGMHGYMHGVDYVIKIEVKKALNDIEKNYLLKKALNFYNKKYNISFYDSKSNIKNSTFKIYYIVIEGVKTWQDIHYLNIKQEYNYYKKINQTFLCYELKKMIDKNIKKISITDMQVLASKFLRG